MPRILIVDDDRTQAEQFATLLRDAGCDVTLAGNGREATDLLRLKLPDVVLTDLERLDNSHVGDLWAMTGNYNAFASVSER